MSPLLVALCLPRSIHLVLADGEFRGVTVATTRPGYSGRGYVTGFTKDGDEALISFQAEAGLYDARIRYCSPSGPKGFGLRVDHVETSGMFAQTDQGWHVADAGRVELQDGTNVLEVTKGWGYFDVDSVELTPAKLTPLRQPPGRLADRQASPIARRLYRALLAGYGKRMVSGQYDSGDARQVNEATGKWPAILGADFMDYSPTRVAHGAKPDGEVESWVAEAKAGEVLTLSWHWNAPDHLLDRVIQGPEGKPEDARWYKGFYTYASTFDVATALAHPESKEYREILRDLDAIAAQLGRIQAAGIPVLWRPLHEADGRWFWWGAKGPGPFKQLWRLMFDRFTRVHHLHNLIWVLSAPDAAWYPGDDVVDVVGIDAYPADPSDPQSATWEELQKRFNGRKPLAITEFGKVPDADRAFRFGATWLYWVSWTGDLGAAGMDRDALIRRYGEKRVVVAPLRY